MTKLKLFSPFILLALLSGCSWLNPFSDVTKLNLKLNGSNYLNPDLRGRPSPIVVRIYELKNAVNFANADFFGLYDNAKNALGDELVATEEIELRPAQQLNLRFKINSTSQYVGIMAAYRDISEANWRYVIKVEPKEISYVNLVLTSDGIYKDTDPRAKQVNETLPIEDR